MFTGLRAPILALFLFYGLSTSHGAPEEHDVVLQLIGSFVCASIIDKAEKVFEARDLTATLNPKSETFGMVLDSQITQSNSESLRKLKAALADGVEWHKGSVSALAEKGEKLLIFVDKNGFPLLGLYNEQRWGENRYQLARISKELNGGFRLAGTVPVNELDQTRKHPRDVPIVFEP